MANKAFQKKIDSIKIKNAIKILGCKQENLKIFNFKELQDLNKRGLITDEMFHKEMLIREIL